MFIDKAKERLFYISLYILAEWWVEPYYLSRSVSLPSLAGLGVFGVLDFPVVSACPEGLVVNFSCVVKLVPVRRQSRYPPANGARDLFYDGGWVVALGIDVERIIAWRSVGVILSGFQVERNIQVVHHLKVALNCDFEPEFLEYFGELFCDLI